MNKLVVLTFSWGMLLAAGTPPLQAQTDEGKNICDVTWRALPNPVSELLELLPASRWNSGFRKYGSTSDMLWTDTQVTRDVSAGQGFDINRFTKLAAVCDEDGFSVVVYCGEPALTNWWAKKADYPSPCIEFFFVPGDADTPAITPHHMGVYQKGAAKEFAFMVQDRNCRRFAPYFTAGECVVGQAIMVRMTMDWEGLFDKLPIFADKADNFWRLSVIRWADCGFTWGGVVHQMNQAGYLRWPKFTEEQKLAIMRKTLVKGWNFYRTVASDYSYAPGGGPGVPKDVVKMGYPVTNAAQYAVEELKANPQSYVNMNQDPAFCPELGRIFAERNALLPMIGEMDKRAPADREAFYRKAADMLFNCRYDIERAYGAYQQDLLLRGVR